MRTIARIRWGRVLLISLITIGMAAMLLTSLFEAVIQESFKITPPTQAELAEDPSLAVYTEGQGK